MMERFAKRPHCLWCEMPLGKSINHVSIHIDTRPMEGLREKLKGRPFELVDKESTAEGKRENAIEAFNDRLARSKEAQQNLMTMGPPETMADKQKWRWENDFAEEPDRSRYTYTVRVWFGKYGYDGLGLFHCKECARLWANQVAGKLRKEGKL